jgi:adenine phosphoribosyltransferase
MRASLLSSLIIDKNGYPYMVHPITDGIPAMDPDVLDEVIDWLASSCCFDCDRILAPEAMGIPLAVPLSLRTRIPYTIIRKRSYGIEGEIPIVYNTGYSEQRIYVNGLKKGDRVVIVDDVLSTGGTLAALVNALRMREISIEGVLMVLNKGTVRDELSTRLGIDIKRMFDISLGEDGTITVTEP